MKPTMTLEQSKTNAEEDYMTTPISVLKYISDLEKEIKRLTYEGIKEWNCPTCGKCESFQVVQRHIKCKKCEQQFTTDL